MGFMLTHTFTIIMVLEAVAYLTLFERKVLAAVQLRKGPNKVGFAGLAQPIADGIKLFSKEFTRLSDSNHGSYWVAPSLALFISLCMWELVPYKSCLVYYQWGGLFFLCGSSLSVYPIIIAGWSSNSKYATLGAMRAIAQVISYEVVMGLILFSQFMLSSSLMLQEVSEILGSAGGCSAFMCPPLFAMWLSCLLAETHRSPFDFAEGESELVSGFNVEYGAVGFSFIFLAEYSNILMMSMMTSAIFLGGSSGLGMPFKAILVCYFVILSRATLPRFRYDLLMQLTWKRFLPLTLSILVLIISLLLLAQV